MCLSGGLHLTIVCCLVAPAPLMQLQKDTKDKGVAGPRVKQPLGKRCEWKGEKVVHAVRWPHVGTSAAWTGLGVHLQVH